jgi:tRNA(Ile)-lysidine synthase
MKETALFKQFNASLSAKIKERSGLTVALSGGVDSVVLLYLCKTYLEFAQSKNISLEAVYINHGLSEQASTWQKFCKELCNSLDIPFKSKSLTIELKPRQSLEAVARDLRYKALDELAQKDNIILLGQHADDQLETFLLRLKRGSGLTGLSAMRDEITLSSGRRCIRPMLNISRQDIECFATTFAIKHIEDASNKDDKFDRNFFRNQIIPPLKARFSGFLKSTLRSIELLQQQQSLIDEISSLDLVICEDSRSNPSTLKLEALSKFSVLRQNNVVRAWLGSLNVAMPSRTQLSQILIQAFEGREDANMQIQLSNGVVRRYRDKLYFDFQRPVPSDVSAIASHEVRLEHLGMLRKQNNGLLRKPNNQEVVSVRFGTLKARIKPFKKVRHNTLKYWLKELKVPTWQREFIPLIYYDNELVQVVGYFVSAEYVDQADGIDWQLDVEPHFDC